MFPKFYTEVLGLTCTGEETVEEQKVKTVFIPCGETLFELLHRWQTLSGRYGGYDQTLLKAIGVPWQVIVHHQIGVLQVDHLPRSVGCNQDQNSRIAAKLGLNLASIVPVCSTMDHPHGLRLPQEITHPLTQVIRYLCVR